jgi:hypothetical protein
MLQEGEKQLNEWGLRGEQSSPHSPPPAVLGPLRAVKLPLPWQPALPQTQATAVQTL